MLLCWVTRLGSSSPSSGSTHDTHIRGFDAIIEQRERLLSMMRMMIATRMRPIACFVEPERALKEFEQRLSPPSDPKARRKFVDEYTCLIQTDRHELGQLESQVVRQVPMVL